MKRLLILAVCAALISTSGCRNCRRRGAPCRSSLSFDPYTAAPAACGVDAFAGPACGEDVTVGCPHCPGGVAGMAGDVVEGPYYEGGALAPVPATIDAGPPAVNIDGGIPTQPIAP